MKICSKCKKEKHLDLFSNNKTNKDGKHSWCKECIKKQRELKKEKYNKRKKIYYKENIEKIREYDAKRREQTDYKSKKSLWDKNYREKNKEKINEQKKLYYQENKEEIRNKAKNKYANDPELRKKNAITGRRNYLKNPEPAKERNKKYKQKKRKESPVYRINEQVSKGIRRSLKLNRPGAHWEEFMPFKLEELIKLLKSKFTKGMSLENYGEWEIDHIVPLSYFKFESVNDKGFKKAWSLNNLQPMWKFENQSKSNRYSGRYRKIR
jgi:hypothetical protein